VLLWRVQKCRVELEDLLQGTLSSPTYCVRHRLGSTFPYPTTFPHLQTHVNAVLKLKHQPMPGKLLYVGSMEVGKHMVVKFVRSYCMSIVPLLVSHFGFKKPAGGW
jgi:hypothetical protein